MDLIKFKSFLTVARLGSFSKAAEVLFFSQPAISAHIKELESEYDTALFNREGRSIELTNSGKALIYYLESILTLFDESKSALNNLKGMGEGRIAIGTSRLPGSHFLPELIAGFKSLNPEVEFDVTVQKAMKIREMVLKKKLDIGIIGSQTTENPDPRLVESTIGKDEMVLAIPNSHPLSNRECVSIRKLKDLKLIVSFKDTLSRQAINHLFLKYDVPYVIGHEIDDKAMMISMVQAGLGSAFFTYSEIRREAESSWISILRIEEEELYRNIVLIRHRDSELSPSGEAFYEYLLGHSGQPHPVVGTVR